ncbi:MAG: polysaccharide deacetylase family protein [Chitinophagaceae bacterium]
MFYLVKTPWWIKKIFPSFIWNISTKEKNLYLTFDDGPNEKATPFVLDELKKFNAKATFFCIGKNVLAFPEIYKRIIDEGHKVGNHTHNHLNGKKTSNKIYIENIFEAAKYIDSNLFRPPYGRITNFQARILENRKLETENRKSKESIQYSVNNIQFKIIMWTVLSGDFDIKISPKKCLQNVLSNAESGSIIVFHDSTKAFEKMNFALPKVLEYFKQKDFAFSAIE